MPLLISYKRKTKDIGYFPLSLQSLEIAINLNFKGVGNYYIMYEIQERNSRPT